MELYEILGVEKRATDDDLKRAYKKLALKYHPDRNYNKVEEATAQFAKVQAAYDVLSDPQERAWYDSHGLTGGSSGFAGYDNTAGRVTTADDLRRFFDPMLYQNTGDGPDGIYQIANGIFETLAKEEKEAVFEQYDLDNDYADLPKFGDRLSNWSRETKPFYDVWLNFSSKKTFAWCDQYRTKDAPDRRTRRAMENENKKARDAARKEFNDTVRTLTSFIRKRDPRFKLRAKHTGTTKMSAKAQANAVAREQAARAKKANANKHEEYEEQEWEKVEEEEFDEYFSDSEEKKKARRKAKGLEEESESEEENDEFTKVGNVTAETDEELVDVFECVVCDKIFKSQKQLVSHEQSKKHIKTLQKLKYDMQKEGIELGIDGDEVSLKTPSGESENSKDSSSDSSSEESSEEEVVSNKAAKPSFSVLMQGDSDSDNDSDTESEQEIKSEPVKTKSSSSKPNTDSSLQDLLSQLESAKLSGSKKDDDSDDDWGTNSKKGKKKGKNGKKGGGGSSNSASNIPKQYQGFLAEETESASKVGRAKQKKMKRAQQNDVLPTCSVCQTSFDSRNKLFDHIKVSGHAAKIRL